MSNARQLKKENMRSVIQVIRNSDAFTKPEIAQATGLTGATVHSIILELEERGLLDKCGFSCSNGGRKAQLYKVANDYRYVVGIALRTNKIVIGIFDFCMKMLCERSYEWTLGDHSVEETVHAMNDFFLELVEENGLNRDKIVAVGVNVPGPVDYRTGRIFSLRGYSKWHNINLADELGRLMGMRVLVDKDVNSGILLIKQLEKSPSDANMLYISVEEGIGAGIMINGEIYRGNHGVAGEIGHTTVQENGEKCNCGNIGCLELVSSDFAIIRKARAILGLTEEEKFTVEEAMERSRGGEKDIEEVFVTATKYLATTIRNSFMLYDPDEIFIRCKWLELNKKLFFKLIDDLYDENTLIDRGNIKISLVNEERFVLKSAAAIVWNYELESLDSDTFSS